MAKNDTKQELARVLYMSGLSQEEILQKVEVSRQNAQLLDKHPGMERDEGGTKHHPSGTGE